MAPETPWLRAGRNLVALLAWGVWLPWHWGGQVCRGAWRFFRARRWRQVAGVLTLGLLGGAAYTGVPLLYGRHALVLEAEYLASTSLGRDREAMVRRLTREAFRLGFTDVITQPRAVVITDAMSPEGYPLCIITIELRHHLPLPGSRSLPVPIRARVERYASPAPPEPKSLEDLIRVE